MAVAKIKEETIQSQSEAKPGDPNAVSSLAQRLKDCLDDWDTDHMAKVIHKGAQGSTNRMGKTSKASR